MDKSKKYNESEMGSGDSDDEFYNVNLPCSSDVASEKTAKKVEVKKVYSPPRTKVQYDYKFDSSSDDEFENIKNNQKSDVATKVTEKDNVKTSLEKKEISLKENTNLPESTFKVVEKINEELKNMKNAGGKPKSDTGENINMSHITTSAVQQPQLGIVPPVVVVHPSTQSAMMNVGPMIVPSSIGVAGQNSMAMMQSQNVMGVPGNMLRGPSAMGGLMTSPGNSMIGVPGMMGMQGNIVGMPGNGMAGQGNVMGLQGSMINPAAMGGLMQGNMMRMATAGSSMLRMQSPGNNMMGVNLVGVPRPVGLQLPGNIIGNPGGMIMNPGNVISNPMMNPGGLMVMGGVLGNPGVVGANQATSSNLVRMASNNQVTSLPRAVPPPPFARGKPPAPPGNFRWQANPRMQVNIPSTNSPTTSKPLLIPGVSTPTSSPVERESREYDGDELSRDDKDNSSDKSSSLETDESQSPPRELPNTFKNDGSFMEIFKKMKEQSQETKSSTEKSGGATEVGDSSSTVKKPSVMLSGIVGKRRGGRVLKTGLVKKVKKESDQEDEKHPTDAWSMYMAEVKKYKEASCEEEGKTRPLVK